MTDPKTFDLRAALAGVSFPEETVTIFLDASKMYEYAQLKRKADYNPADEELQKSVEDFENIFKESAIQVTIRDIPVKLRKDILKRVHKDFPPDTHPLLGQKVNTQDGEEEFQTQLWAAHIVEMRNAQGGVLHPTADDIRALRDTASVVTLGVIREAIDRLTSDTTSGYEQIVQGLDFLSQPSQPETPDSTTP